MQQAQQKMFPDLGFGLGLRPKHYPYIFEHKPAVDWFEIISENFMDTDGRPRRMLDRVLEDYPVVMHGVSLSIGTLDPVDSDYLRKLKALAAHVKPAWISDHLCWTGVAHKNTHDLLPVPYTEQALSHIVDRIRRVQDVLGRVIVLENPSTYLEFTSSSMPEWEFIARMADAAGCGLLLDVNNIYVSCYNHKWDPKTYIDALPLDRVAQIHLAGHSNNGTHIVDTHDDHVVDEVWALYRYVIGKAGAISTMIEWDAKIPEFDVVVAELDKARHWRVHCDDGTLELPEFQAFRDNLRPRLTPLDLSEELGAMQNAILQGDAQVMDPDVSVVPKPDFSPDAQIDVYIKGYRYRLYDMVYDEYPALRVYLGATQFARLVDAYIEAIPSRHYNLSRYVEKFPAFVADYTPAPDRFAQELVVLETAISRLADDDETPVLTQQEAAKIREQNFLIGRLLPRKALKLFAFSNDVNGFYDAAILHGQNDPPLGRDVPCFLALYRHEDRMQRLSLDEGEYLLLASLFGGLSIGDSLESIMDESGDGDTQMQVMAEKLQSWFSRWINNGVLSSFEV
ncbi:MAG: DUF692 family multinuclear iron-containing protein [Bdellovibrionales bacterium]